MSKKLVVAGASLALVLIFVAAAWAASNSLSASVSVTNGPTVHCGGSNTILPAGTREQKVLVSYVCQRLVSGVWHDIGTAPASSCRDCAGTGYHETTINCGNLGGGRWSVRAQVDGYFVDYQNHRTDTAAKASPNTVTVSC
jgi:hypothetical protein